MSIIQRSGKPIFSTLYFSVDVGSNKKPTSTSPLSIFHLISSAFPDKIEKVIDGYLFVSLWSVLAILEVVQPSKAPIVRWPDNSAFFRSSKTCTVLLVSCKISSALILRNCPSSVKISFFPSRIKSCVSSSRSSSLICLDNVGCVIYNCSAALDTVPAVATVQKYFNNRSSIYSFPI